MISEKYIDYEGIQSKKSFAKGTSIQFVDEQKRKSEAGFAFQDEYRGRRL